MCIYLLLQDATIEELYKLLEDKTGVPPEHARLIHGGKEIHADEDHKLISDYKGIVHGSVLFMVLRLLGGSDHEREGTDDEAGLTEESKDLDALAPLTDEPDMITLDDDPDGKRAKMPCGHAISPDSLTAYCRSLLSSGKYLFLCPYISPDRKFRCNREWTYIEVRRFGVLNKFEQKDFETRITETTCARPKGYRNVRDAILSACEKTRRTSD